MVGKDGATREAIAARVRTARELAGLSQGQVARLLGLHRPTVSEIEAGRRSIKAEELGELAQLYGVSIKWLSGGPDGDDHPRNAMLAARELSRLSSADLERLIGIIRAVSGRGEKE